MAKKPTKAAAEAVAPLDAAVSAVESSADDLLRQKFWDLCAKRDAIRATRDPLRARRDAFVQEMRAKEKEMDAEIAAVEAPLFDLDNAIARLSRGLNHKTGG